MNECSAQYSPIFKIEGAEKINDISELTTLSSDDLATLNILVKNINEGSKTSADIQKDCFKYCVAFHLRKDFHLSDDESFSLADDLLTGKISRQTYYNHKLSKIAFSFADIGKSILSKAWGTAKSLGSKALRLLPFVPLVIDSWFLYDNFIKSYHIWQNELPKMKMVGSEKEIIFASYLKNKFYQENNDLSLVLQIVKTSKISEDFTVNFIGTLGYFLMVIEDIAGFFADIIPFGYLIDLGASLGLMIGTDMAQKEKAEDFVSLRKEIFGWASNELKKTSHEKPFSDYLVNDAEGNFSESELAE